jgi:hypothetical protein
MAGREASAGARIERFPASASDRRFPPAAESSQHIKRLTLFRVARVRGDAQSCAKRVDDKAERDRRKGEPTG